ncbi:Thioredoxin domain-containing protein 3, partial [Bulinus truncatus]
SSYDDLIKFITSGPSCLLVLTIGQSGETIIDFFRQLMGPKEVEAAKEENPNCIRARFGEKGYQNAIHGSDSAEAAARELALFFPTFVVPTYLKKRLNIQRTLAIIKPEVYASSKKDEIISAIKQCDLKIMMMKEVHLTKEQAAEFYKEHEQYGFFDALVELMCSGPMLALGLVGDEAISVWREKLGPDNVDEAIEKAPKSFRARYTGPSGMNQFHGSSTDEAAVREIAFFFPIEQTVALIKPSAMAYKDEIIQYILDNGYKIATQAEIVITLPLISDLYPNLGGMEYFDELTNFLMSGPSLFLILSREDAINGWRRDMGESDPLHAKEENPNSVRALFGTDIMNNAVHGSSNSEHAKQVMYAVFGEHLSFNEDGTLKGDDPGQMKDQFWHNLEIMLKIKQDVPPETEKKKSPEPQETEQEQSDEPKPEDNVATQENVEDNVTTQETVEDDAKKIEEENTNQESQEVTNNDEPSVQQTDKDDSQEAQISEQTPSEEKSSEVPDQSLDSNEESQDVSEASKNDEPETDTTQNSGEEMAQEEEPHNSPANLDNQSAVEEADPPTSDAQDANDSAPNEHENKTETDVSQEKTTEEPSAPDLESSYDDLIKFITSGPSCLLVLTIGQSGETIIDFFRQLMGPKEVEAAKEENPNCIRARFGEKGYQNAIHGSDSAEAAARELALFFPTFVVPTYLKKRLNIQRTLAIIKPEVYASPKRDEIISAIKQCDLKIMMMKEVHLTKEQAAEFYKEHEQYGFFDALVELMCSGPMLALGLVGDEAISVWREKLGPDNVDEAIEKAPKSFRARYTGPSGMNQFHGSSTEEAAVREIAFFFPIEQTVALIKPSAMAYKDEIIQYILDNGYKIATQAEIVITLPLISVLYPNLGGMEYFDELTNFLMSGPSLFLILSREDAINGWRRDMGESDPLHAKEENPNSVRALFGTDIMNNAVHGSSNSEHAKQVMYAVFGEHLSFNEDGTLKGDEPGLDETAMDVPPETEKKKSPEPQETEQEQSDEPKPEDNVATQENVEDNVTTQETVEDDAKKIDEENTNQESQEVTNNDEPSVQQTDKDDSQEAQISEQTPGEEKSSEVPDHSLDSNEESQDVSEASKNDEPETDTTQNSGEEMAQEEEPHNSPANLDNQSAIEEADPPTSDAQDANDSAPNEHENKTETEESQQEKTTEEPSAPDLEVKESTVAE